MAAGQVAEALGAGKYRKINERLNEHDHHVGHRLCEVEVESIPFAEIEPGTAQVPRQGISALASLAGLSVLTSY